MVFKGEQDIAYHNCSLKLCTIGFRNVCNVTRLPWSEKSKKIASGKMATRKLEAQNLVCGYHTAICFHSVFLFFFVEPNSSEVGAAHRL